MSRPARRALLVFLLTLALDSWLLRFVLDVPAASACFALTFPVQFGAAVVFLAHFFDPHTT